MQLIQLIYTSRGTVPFEPEDLRTLLEKSRQNNHGRGLTGMLVYHEGSFLQILEGEPHDVMALYAKIEADERHDNVKLLLRSDIEERSFGEWKMGFVDTAEVEEQHEGFLDFFNEQNLFVGEDADRARSVLLQFRDGSWRQTA